MLTGRQRELLDLWLPGAEVVRDHSWGLVGTTVLELSHDGGRYVAKAGDAEDRHIARELTAHRRWLDRWSSRGRAARLVHADDGAKLLVATYQPGELMLGHPDELRPDLYRQAGELLAEFHGQAGTDDPDFEPSTKAKALAWLDCPHRIAPQTEARLREVVGSWTTAVVRVVPTHGDWHPRNWLVDDGVVSVIDFGRAALRPPETDLVRLAAQQFRAAPSSETAFLDGYGSDPREPRRWLRHLLCEAIGTAVWAHQVGDERFEQQGHRMITEAMAEGERAGCDE